MSKDIGIDLGTASVLVYVKGKGIVLNEPSVVALDKNTGKLLKVGADAQAMLGRTPGNIVAIRPLREGVISDYDMTELMLREFIHKVAGVSLFKPRVLICIPSGITEVEERAVVDAGIQAGARKVYLIEEPVAAAIGAGIDITQPDGHMVVDIGGGTADLAVLSLSGVFSGELWPPRFAPPRRTLDLFCEVDLDFPLSPFLQHFMPLFVASYLHDCSSVSCA